MAVPPLKLGSNFGDEEIRENGSQWFALRGPRGGNKTLRYLPQTKRVEMKQRHGARADQGATGTGSDDETDETSGGSKKHKKKSWHNPLSHRNFFHRV